MGAGNVNVSCHFDASEREVVATPKLLGSDRHVSNDKVKVAAAENGKDQGVATAPDTSLADDTDDQKSSKQADKKSDKKSGLQCPAGHALVDCRVPCRAQCDGCGCVLEEGQHAMDCRPCDFILCDACRWLKVVGAPGPGVEDRFQEDCETKGKSSKVSADSLHGAKSNAQNE